MDLVDKIVETTLLSVIDPYDISKSLRRLSVCLDYAVYFLVALLAGNGALELLSGKHAAAKQGTYIVV